MTALAAMERSGVAQRRHEPHDSLEYFPTPPWATRAFVEHVLHPIQNLRGTVKLLEPACGEGHMAEVLKEYGSVVSASDVHDYGYGDVCDFLGEADDFHGMPDWVITNPPFSKAVQFAETAVDVARKGVALLVRTQWLHGVERFKLFQKHRPALIAYYFERVPMHKGRWVPKGSTATEYCWVVWRKSADLYQRYPLAMWIPPGCRKALTKPDDVRRFAPQAAVPLLEGGA